MKICTKCKLEKNLEDFSKYRNVCKKCRYLYSSKFREKNPGYHQEYSKNWRINNPDYVSEKNKKFRENNPDYQSEWYLNNSDAAKLYSKLYYINNKEENLKRSKEHRESNKDYYREYSKTYSKTYFKNRKKCCNLFRLSCNIRTLISSTIKSNGYSKKTRTYEILGCTFEEFKLYLESKFEPWMTWENRGLYNGELNYGWDIDHIIPISSAKTEEDIIKLNHYTNFQPLCSYTNRYVKRNKIEI